MIRIPYMIVTSLLLMFIRPKLARVPFPGPENSWLHAEGDALLQQALWVEKQHHLLELSLADAVAVERF